MTNLVSVLKDQVVKQDRETALMDCFTSWDDQLDVEVILQGIHARRTALGYGPQGLLLRRQELGRIDVVNEEGFTVLTFMICSYQQSLPGTYRQFTYGDKWLFVSGNWISYFQSSELEKAGKWLMENFHH